MTKFFKAFGDIWVCFGLMLTPLQQMFPTLPTKYTKASLNATSLYGGCLKLPLLFTCHEKHRLL
ncbi:hypothetical protein RB2083_1831 [Rhodobacteraceae bacterium HTCC2083]|nr:hypothetical protein RB2083_1831 [Rhodobacteraceae bacterium HTCC2083]